MKGLKMTYKIGVDSGGTHIVATSYTEDNKKIKTAKAGPGNIFIDSQSTVDNITESIKKLEQNNDTCSKILIGIAGLETIKDPKPFLSKIRANLSNICTNIIFTSDAKLALINNLENKDGFLVIAGTGSIVYGKQSNQYIRAGGWGPALDDVCSGYKISQAAIIKVVNDYDKGETNSLTQLTLNYFKQKDIPALVSTYYKLDRTTIASFAQRIASQAKNDVLVQNILKKQALNLADKIINLIHRYDQNNIRQVVAFSGSVLVNNEFIRNIIISRIIFQYPKMKFIISNHNNNYAVNYI